MREIDFNEVLATPHCWDMTNIKEWFEKQGKEKVTLRDALEDPDMMIADKVWAFISFNPLTDNQSQILAVRAAWHWLPENAEKGYEALKQKALWLFGIRDGEELKEAERGAWDEAQTIPESKAAAYACKKDPQIALVGTIATAGGWFGATIHPAEKAWQLERMLELLGDKDV